MPSHDAAKVDRLRDILTEIERLAWPMDGRDATRIVNLAIKGKQVLDGTR